MANSRQPTTQQENSSAITCANGMKNSRVQMNIRTDLGVVGRIARRSIGRCRASSGARWRNTAHVRGGRTPVYWAWEGAVAAAAAPAGATEESGLFQQVLIRPLSESGALGSMWPCRTTQRK